MDGDINWGAAAIAFCGVVAAFYLLMPWLVFGTQRMNGDPQVVLFDMEKKRPPARVAEYFEETGEALLGLGYEPQPCVALPDPMPNARALVRLWVHPERRDAALVSAIFGTSEETIQKLQLYYTEFLSRFDADDVTLIYTNNSTMISSFPDLPNELAFRFPQVEDIARLDRLHRKLVDRHAPAARKIVSLNDQHQGRVVSYIRSVLLDGYRKQETTGYLVYREYGNYWRPTPKGAYLMTWAQLWPMKTILLQRIYRRARRLLRELEAGDEL